MSPSQPSRSHLRRWGAAYLLLALFLASWVAQFVAQMIEFGNEARSHGEAFSMVDYWPAFLSSTFENWQSEWLQLLVQAVVLLGMKHLIFKADAEDMEQVQLDLAEIKERLGIPPRDEESAQLADSATASARQETGDAGNAEQALDLG